MALFGLFGRKPSGTAKGRQRLVAEQWPAALYVIGDVHGCLDLLIDLEARITADATAIEGEKWIVQLGDHVDRGPDSAGVLDHLLAPAPAGFQRHVLAGNHEALMLDYLDAPHPNHDWLRNGGDRTLQSYGIDPTAMTNGLLSRQASMDLLAAHIPARHITLMRAMPVCLSLPGAVLVHAGIRRDVPLSQQSDRDLMWMRPDKVEVPQPPGAVLVVHGHTPAAQPFVTPYRIDIDTGAAVTGILTAARLGPEGLQRLIATGATPQPGLFR